MFERFTEKARQTLTVAQAEASARNAGEIGNDHMLMALCADETSVASKILGGFGVDRVAVAEFLPARATEHLKKSPQFGRGTRKLLENSLREALQLGHNYIGTEHILLALVRAGDETADWLAGHGLTSTTGRVAVLEALGHGTGRGRRIYPRRTGRVTEAPTPYELARQGAAANVDQTGDELLALAAEEGSAAQQALAALGVDAESLADAVRRVAAESASVDGPVVLDLGDGVALAFDSGAFAREIRDLLGPLVEKAVVPGSIADDGTFRATLPGMRDTLVFSAVAWIQAVAETT